MNLKKHSAEKQKGHFKYESMLKAMPQDIVKELVRRRLNEIAEYEKRQKQKT